MDHKPILSAIPPEYVHYRQWPEYAYQHTWHPFFQPKVIDIEPRGIRRGLWPLFIEEYVSDTEPQLKYDPSAPNRCILWRRISRKDVPSGWYEPSKRPGALESFVELRPGTEYASLWSKIARNERGRWLKLQGIRYRIENINGTEFKELFRRSKAGQKIGTSYARLFLRKLQEDPSHIKLYGARDMGTGLLVAGIGVINSSTYRSSFYDLGCKLESAQDPVMVGLMDHWFKISQADNIRFLQLGECWLPGKPKSWKGFSFFKSKFKPAYIEQPPVLLRLVRGRLF